LVAAVTLVIVLGSLGLLAAITGPPAAGAEAGPSPSSPAPLRASTPSVPTVLPAGSPVVTHGDLVIGPGQKFVILPSLAGPTYYQGGNITVEAGGTLLVENVTLSFVSYVGGYGTPLQRLDHIYHFSDAGTVEFFGANLTTYVQTLAAYAKLNLTITGSLSLTHSAFEFPGWINVDGASASLTANSSTITGNPAVLGLNENPVILGDTSFAASVRVENGAALNLLNSSLNQTYAWPQTGTDVVRPTPLQNGNFTVLSSPGVIPVYAASDLESLALDWAYPSALARSGFAEILYDDPNGQGRRGESNNTAVDLSVSYNGTSYAIGSYTFINGTSGAVLLPFLSPVMNAFNATGLLGYLNLTGAWGGTPSIGIDYTTVSGPSVFLTDQLLQYNTTGVTYNVAVTNASMTVADSSVDLNWNSQPSGGDPYSQTSPFGFNSNKLLLTDGSDAYLANLSVPTTIPGVFSTSAILPDLSSHAYFYRWAQFHLTGRDGILTLVGARTVAYYAYNSNQTNNATAAALNDLASADPVLWRYVQYWDSQYGIPDYGTSNAEGNAYVLLASTNLTGSLLPDGNYLGGYHVGFVPPTRLVSSVWFNWSVSPFPTGVALGTPGYQGPDAAPPQSFNGYYGAAEVANVTIEANGTAAPSVRIGQNLTIAVTVNDTGTAPISELGGTLSYNTTTPVNVTSTPVDLVAPGQQAKVNFTWLVNDTITGLQGKTFPNAFPLVVQYNHGEAQMGGGSVDLLVVVEIAPAAIYLSHIATPGAPGSLTRGNTYFVNGIATYAGTGVATAVVTAKPVNGGAPVLINATTTVSGKSFTVVLAQLDSLLAAGTDYNFILNVSFNGAYATYSMGPYSVPSTPLTATTFFTQSVLGLPLWLWLAIAAAIVVGLVLFLTFARRQAAGKLVECGECGNLIPEDATVCPKCGAEFEHDLIRCSRCASTIPADSKVCPECAAVLLGKPGEAEADPERQGYADFTERYRAEAKRELGDNYSEGAFWDWWKRQPTYTSFSQWKLQQGTGTARAGMTAPPAASASDDTPAPPPRTPPPGAGGAGTPLASPTAANYPAPPPGPLTGAAAAAPPSTAPAAAPAGNLKACPSCNNQIPSDYLICPFCNSVTQ
jgi:RNA polymerase subunit RPABC4/transcription elongation factor Spt4